MKDYDGEMKVVVVKGKVWNIRSCGRGGHNGGSNGEKIEKVVLGE